MKNVFGFWVVFMFLGCMRPIADISPSGLKAYLDSPSGSFATVHRGLFYTGSDKLYHYFTQVREGALNCHFRIKREELHVDNEFIKTRDSKKWVMWDRILSGRLE
jgi:hypothetical protein